ncbi:MAG: sensor histidine kinase, partial [Paenibacillaceae bacterium]|nr:sensor histidine kinase [Paenibacillaceae bacterium]
PLDLLDLGPRGGTVILNGDGYPITGNGLAPEQTETLQLLVAGGRKGSFTLPGGGGGRDERFLAVVEPFRRANLSLAAVMPESQFLKPLKELQLALTFIPLAVVLVLAIYVLLMQQSLMKPINRLVRGMRHIQEGIFTARVPETRIGELDYLMQSFNAMATQIQQLKIGIYEEQLRTQQAELKHLQAQINPHFYMNTLNIIYNYAALKEYESIQELALLLSEYCRFAMRTGQAEIPLETEFHHIANYLNIQKIRFESRLTYEVALPDACKPLLILPLTVQPLVENAIVHGFKGKRKLHVTLSCALRLEDEREFLEVLVSDNGEGFSEQSLLRLGEESGPSASGEHLGIWNVTRRLSMRYGGAMSVHFANKPDGGAVVALRLPIYNYASEEDKPNDYDAGRR